MQSTGSGGRNLEYYSAQVKKLGDSPKTFWNSRRSQEERFRALARIGDFYMRSILDVGCGTGDFLRFLNEEGHQFIRYVGCDLVEEAIQIARRKYPFQCFHVSDVRELEFDHKFDFVIGSGLFALNEEGWKVRVLEIVRAMYALCRIGVGINFLSEFGPNRNPGSTYSDPGEMFTFLSRQISSRASLDHTYKENDFTIFLYRPQTAPSHS